MQCGKFWLITTDSIKGPWQVSSLNDGSGKLGAGSWYIVNQDTGKFKRIGPVNRKGTNYFDESVSVAKERNAALGFSQE